MMGAPVKGVLLLGDGPIGELTDVASANRAVRGVLMDKLDDELDVRGRTDTSCSFFSSIAVV